MKDRKVLIGGIAALVIVILVLILIIGSCRSNAPDSQEPTKDTNAAITAAYQTAESMRLATASAMPTLTPTVELSPTATPTITPTITLTGATPTLGAPPGPGALRVVFIDDVTVKDGTVFAPNTPFTKTWRIQNGGTVTWTTAFVLAFQSGEQMGAPSQVPMLQDVAPGAIIDITVNMVAPANPGRFISNWLMRDPSGTLFGLDPEAKYPIYVDITVSGTAGTVTPSPSPTLGTPGTPTVTPSISATPSPTQGNLVSGMTLEVDSANASACPHTFTFVAKFTLSQASTVTYKLEAAATDPNITITLPPPVTTNLEAGQQTLVYALDFTSAVSGYAQFHMTAPSDLRSNQVNFSLTCP